MDLVGIAVGERIDDSHICGDGIFQMTAAGPILFLKWDRITAKELKAVKNGTPQFGLKVIGDVLFFLCRLGNLNWMDFPYNIHATEYADLSEDIPDGKGYGLTIVLIEALDHRVAAIRHVGMATEISRKIRDILIDQAQRPFNPQQWVAEYMRLQRKYTTEDLVRQAETLT